MTDKQKIEFDETLLQYSNSLDELKAENEKYKQVLSEIKEIAEAYEATYNAECKQLCCTEILQLINEVKL